MNTETQTETDLLNLCFSGFFKSRKRTQTKADLLNLCFGAFFSRVWLLFRLEGGRGVIQAGHGALHPPLLNHRLQLTDVLLVVTHLHKFVKPS